MRAALGHVNDYPDASAFYLKSALAAKLDVTPAHLIVGNGADEIIDALVRTCVRPNENVVLAQPAFISYKMRVQQSAVALREVPLAHLRFDLPAMAKAVDHATKMVFVANPNNPTGTYVTASELSAFAEALPRDTVLVIDEAYVEYVRASDYPDSIALMRARPRTIVLRTFSKVYGLAGVRVGYGIGDPELIGFLERGRMPFNCGALGQVAATAALADSEHVRQSVELNAREMDRVVPALRAMTSQGKELVVTDSQANFILVDVHASGPKTFDALLNRASSCGPWRTTDCDARANHPRHPRTK